MSSDKTPHEQRPTPEQVQDVEAPDQFDMIHCRLCNSKILRNQNKEPVKLSKVRIVLFDAVSSVDVVTKTKSDVPSEIADSLFKENETEAEFCKFCFILQYALSSFSMVAKGCVDDMFTFENLGFLKTGMFN